MLNNNNKVQKINSGGSDQLKRSKKAQLFNKGSSLFMVSIVKFMILSNSFYTIFNSGMFLKFRLFVSSFM